ncbi:MAG TPA: hypothetical protein VMS17_17790 [Gemmataceae bacterium]|nr:hypothetical protein [Gemmataceae bacterium]
MPPALPAQYEEIARQDLIRRITAALQTAPRQVLQAAAEVILPVLRANPNDDRPRDAEEMAAADHAQMFSERQPQLRRLTRRDGVRAFRAARAATPGLTAAEYFGAGR